MVAVRKLKVGELFKEGVTRYREGIVFDIDQTGPMLLLFYDKPDEQEIVDIKNGSTKFRVCYIDNVIFFLAKLGNQQWMDAPYNIHLSQSFILEEPDEGQGYGLSVFLVDAHTGLLKVTRLIGLPNNISLKLKEFTEEQKAKPFDENNYHQTINSIYAKYTTRELVSMGY